MSNYRIVCVNLGVAPKHHHIVEVGIGDNSGWTQRLSVQAVYQYIDNGDSFYTLSPSSGKVAYVAKYTCEDCKVDTLRSHADGYWDNNLDNLPGCS